LSPRRPEKSSLNLVNMVVVMAGSGTVLLGLLAAKHFQLAPF
jgi:hypothetical protein